MPRSEILSSELPQVRIQNWNAAVERRAVGDFDPKSSTERIPPSLISVWRREGRDFAAASCRLRPRPIVSFGGSGLSSASTNAC